MALNTTPRVLIVGGGFAGLEAAKSLADSKANLILLDRKNHHVFQPLLYQVATASLSPADISASIRSILRDQKNCQVVLAEVQSIDVEQKLVRVRDRPVSYDYLVLAAGATHAYFGKDEWAQFAPGLKTLEDAIDLRRRILLAYESAEYEMSEKDRRAALTFAIVGGGPTGVELAGAIKEIAAQTLPRDYRNIDTRTTQVILFQSGDRILPQFDPKLSQKALNELKKLGVDVRLNSRVTGVNHDGIMIKDEFIPVRNVIWAAGVKASPLGAMLNVPIDNSGRVIVEPDLSIPGHPEVFVIGDMAAAKCESTGQPVPGVAQGGIQMGRYVGKLLANEIERGTLVNARIPFKYFSRGSMAIIGKSKAVAEVGKWKLSGFFAWLAWGLVHIVFLVGFRNRVQVLLSWFWNWLLNARDARLITGTAQLDIKVAPGDPIPDEEEIGVP